MCWELVPSSCCTMFGLQCSNVHARTPTLTHKTLQVICHGLRYVASDPGRRYSDILIIRESVDRFGTKFQNTGPMEYWTGKLSPRGVSTVTYIQKGGPGPPTPPNAGAPPTLTNTRARPFRQCMDAPVGVWVGSDVWEDSGGVLCVRMSVVHMYCCCVNMYVKIVTVL